MGLWLAATAATGLWLLLLLAMAVATRNPPVHAGPPPGELPGQSPALVDLITGDWRLCDEAPSATLLDLAAKGAVQIEEIGPELALVRIRRAVGLNPYEQLVFDHVTSLAVNGVVATGALAEGSRDLGRWWKSFRRKVIAEARAQGLSQPRWNRAQAALLTVTAALPALMIGLAVIVTSKDGDDRGGFGAALVAFGVLVQLMGRLNGERGTRLGAEVAGHWLGVREHLAGGRFAEQPAAAVTIWGRQLAYAAALGLAPRAVTSLPVSTPADDRRAWSDYGGMWHTVQVRYPRRLMWGRRPLPMIFYALVAGAFTGFWTWIALLVASAFDLWPDSLVRPVSLAVGMCVAVVPILHALSDLTTKTTAQGQIVRLRRYQAGSGDNPKYVYWCALDEGNERLVKAYGISAELWDGLSEGDVVRAVLGRRLGWINEIEVLERSHHHIESYSDTGEYQMNAPENLGEVKLFRDTGYGPDPA
ncbi:DUF2207 family protein [Streptosporangium sp. NPDC087985]|uniref:DUF2207 family protein n=1 Tax=Streptosporangium sp. NPDC087985 TaxID=3366196 RepID=UPI0038009715